MSPKPGPFAMNLIFDLDQTLVDSRIAESLRKKGSWGDVYQLIPQFIMYDGMREVLDFVEANNIKYCIVTTSPTPYCSRVCGHWNITQDHLVCYHDVIGRQKPHAAPMHLALSKMNATKEDTISFGDQSKDIIASNAAGTRAVGCLWGCEDPDSIRAAGPFMTIEQPSEIISLLNQLK
jgi:phosphoglycolate phosphatase-like HAD superfamily hydrolase